jgi:AcrR family transcriptional regulator
VTAGPAVGASGPKPTRTELRQRQTRIRLREVAYGLMSTAGVDATTIQQITDAADIGFGTFYNYFDGKDDLAQDVLDCMIHNIGERNDLITQQLGEHDPVRIVANSVRFVIRCMVEDPVFHWWVAHMDLLVDRMRIGFGPFGLRDIDHAIDVGAYRIIADDRALAWSQLNWLMAAGGRDILRGMHPPTDERAIVEGILRVMGVDHTHATHACGTELPPSPDLPIDFSYDIDGTLR